MLLKKMGVTNYFIAMLVLLGITLLLVISIFILTAYIPESLGRNPYNYEINSACEFEPWSFEADGLEAAFPQGGIIVNVNRTDRSRSDLLLGQGTFRYNGQQLVAEQPGGLFMVTDHQLFEQIRGDIFFIPLEDTTLTSQLSSIVDKQIGFPVIWEDTFPMIFHSQEGLIYQYFITPEGDPILPPGNYNTYTALLGSFLVYTLFIIILLMVLTILSPDHRYSNYWIHLGKTKPGFFSLALVPIITGLLAANKIAPEIFGWPEYYTVFGLLLIIVVLILLAKQGIIDYLDFGLRRDKFHRGYLLAVVAAALVVGASRGLPEGLNIDGANTFLMLPLLFILFGLPSEMIWRGYIQTFLSRWLGVTKGLLSMALLAAVVHYVYLGVTVPWMLDYSYTYLEVAIIVPGLAIILGYLYLRTENILACAFLHSLILWLPGIII
ncbi:MAG: CPBP family intramembrane glutamic endopeptidase [Bacillota bacterium]